MNHPNFSDPLIGSVQKVCVIPIVYVNLNYPAYISISALNAYLPQDKI